VFWHGRQMYRRLSEEVRAAGLAAGGGDPQPVTEGDLAGLPAAVRRYMHAMGVVNRPRDWWVIAVVSARAAAGCRWVMPPARVAASSPSARAVEAARLAACRVLEWVRTTAGRRLPGARNLAGGMATSGAITGSDLRK